MNGFRAFLKRKNIEFSAKRYGVDALGAMAQGLFCTLLVGTILNTLGTQFHIGFLSATVVTVGTGETATAYTIGGLASAMVGPAMAVAIGSALQAPPLVLFSLVPVGFATNILGGAGGPLAVLVIAIIAAECGKAVSKETKIDILVTPIVTVLAGIGVAYLVAPPIGKAASHWTYLTYADRPTGAGQRKRQDNRSLKLSWCCRWQRRTCRGSGTGCRRNPRCWEPQQHHARSALPDTRRRHRKRPLR